MLRKHTDLKIDPANPFAEDCLARRPQIKTLTTLVQSTTQPFVLIVEAPWGRGKTTFLRMWRAYLQSEGHVCLYFNAWENDFVDDPLTAFIGEMDEALTTVLEKTNAESPMRQRWETVRRLGGGVLRKALPLAIQVATQGLLGQQAVKNALGPLAEASDDVAEFASEAAAKRIESYQAERKGIHAFRTNLAGLASGIVEEGNGKAPVVFFIDELDRCRPDFAVALLERVKHLFNVQGIFFVLGIDRDQLSHSVRALYGAGMDADGYLRRFIDLAYTLPSPDARAFCTFLSNRFELEEYFQSRPGQGPYGAELLDWFGRLAETRDLSLREIEQCFTGINLVLRTSPPGLEPHIGLLALLVTVKASDPDLYRTLAKSEAGLEALLSYVRPFNADRYEALVEAAFIYDFLPERERDRKVNEWDQLVETTLMAGKGQTEESLRAAARLQSVRKLHNGHTPRPIRSVIDQLNLTSNFS